MKYKYILLSALCLIACNRPAFDESTLKEDPNDSLIVKTAKVIGQKQIEAAKIIRQKQIEAAKIKAEADVKAAREFGLGALNELKPLIILAIIVFGISQIRAGLTE